jgi:DNA-binding transcriptional regulator YhcF (GntR family)
MAWHFRADLPIYTQLVDHLTQGILSGAYAPGQRMPAVRELAAQAGVNPNTMQRALAQMESSGLLTGHRTAGRFVTEDGAVIAAVRSRLARQRTADYLRSMQELGYDHAQVRHLIGTWGEEET